MNAVADIADYLKRHESKPLLRFISCGSVDDGKSTLIGRLLYDSKCLFDDQLATLASDSRRHGTQGENIDYALLLDGLAAEREQGITIDVAYRYFDTDERKFIVADCPGHEQYTRNMVTGASTADLAVVLVDARKGLAVQTRRHSFILGLLGIRRIVLAVNKMDLVGFDQSVFEDIAAGYLELVRPWGIEQVQCIPVSALEGDNLSTRSQRTPWYDGPGLLEYLETVPVDDRDSRAGLRMPVQWVNRPDQNFRGFAGTIATGEVRPGDPVMVLPSAHRSTVARVLDAGVDCAAARAGQAVTLTLTDEIDIGRGDVIVAANDPPQVADHFAAHVLWMDANALLPGRPYWLKIGARTVSATIRAIQYRIDVNTQQRSDASRLEMNEVGYCELELDHPIAFERYAESRALGGFILIDREEHATVAAGTLDRALTPDRDVRRQPLDVDQVARARIKGQTPRVLWFTGLSGAGKSTLANRVDRQLFARGYHTFLLDGDNLRRGLNRDLGFSDADRVENIRRVAEVARLMVDAGLIVLVCLISPFRADRALARSRFEPGEFVEVHVDAPLAVAEARDVKGLYRKARAGQITHFTGIDSAYEAPTNPELHLRTDSDTVEGLTQRVLDYLQLK
jgi:bifunctional enzyme CysN/CysC